MPAPVVSRSSFTIWAVMFAIGLLRFDKWNGAPGWTRRHVCDAT
jgi:hypothetical protein